MFSDLDTGLIISQWFPQFKAERERIPKDGKLKGHCRGLKMKYKYRQRQHATKK